MQVYIMEKPSVGKALADFFNKHGGNFKRTKYAYVDSSQHAVITWTVGHLVTLFEPEDYKKEWYAWKLDNLPLIPDNYGFQVKPKKETMEQYKAVISLIEDATTIIHGGDPDREGQTIVDELLKHHQTGKKIQRLLLNALDDTSISLALADIQPNHTFAGLSLAGETAHYIDWMLGINFTRFFTKKAQEGGFTGTMKVGRVKAPTLHLIVKRYLEKKNFKESVFFTVKPNIPQEGKEYGIPLNLKPNTRYDVEMDAIAKAQQIEKEKAICQNITSTTVEEKIKELYSLDTLQVDANKLLDFSPAQTAKYLQSLYERKFTSYPRSDCKYLPESQFEQAKEIINKLNQTEFVEIPVPIPDSINIPIPYNDKKITAHHAIVPTEQIPNLDELSKEEAQLYKLIVRKYVSMFFAPFTYDKQTVQFTIGDDIAEVVVKNILDRGYKVLFKDIVQEEKEDDAPSELQGVFSFVIGETYPLMASVKEGRTKPPTLFTEGTLVKEMSSIKPKNAEYNSILKEVQGIGTPATRATIIDELITNGLIEKKKQYLIPTKAGMDLDEVLPDAIKEADYTAEMETRLNEVEKKGDLSVAIRMLQDTETYIQEVIANTKRIVNKTYSCPICKEGFLHEKMWKKDGEKIYYYRCNNEGCNKIFPHVKGIPIIIECPKCGQGYMKESRNSKTNAVFYSCSRYPECKHTMTSDSFLNEANTYIKAKKKEANT